MNQKCKKLLKKNHCPSFNFRRAHVYHISCFLKWMYVYIRLKFTWSRRILHLLTHYPFFYHKIISLLFYSISWNDHWMINILFTKYVNTESELISKFDYYIDGLMLLCHWDIFLNWTDNTWSYFMHIKNPRPRLEL